MTFYKAIRELQAICAERRDYISQGKCASYEDYQAQASFCRGIDFAIDVIKSGLNPATEETHE